MKNKWKILFWELSKISLIVTIVSVTMWGIAHAGSLTPPVGTPVNTMYTLGDIYTLATTGTTTRSTDFTTPSSAIPTFHTLEDIVNDYVAPATSHDLNTSGPFVSDGQADLGYLDQSTGLIWQNLDSVQYLCWDGNQGVKNPTDCSGPIQAVEYCRYLGADGATLGPTPVDIWRLPTLKEFQSTIDYSVASPASLLPNTQSDSYWTITRYLMFPTLGSFAYLLYTFDGTVSSNVLDGLYLVRCVR